MDDPLAALGIAPKSIRVKRAWEMAISPAKVRLHLLLLQLPCLQHGPRIELLTRISHP